jgi:uncharacterized protein YkwD
LESASRVPGGNERSSNERSSKERSASGHRRLALVSATLAVAAITSGVLFAGTRVLGTADPASAGAGRRSDIGAAADLTRYGVASAGPEQSGSADPSATPQTATQPAPASPASNAPRATPSATKSTVQPKAATAGDGSVESQVIALVNTERANAGCAALTADSRLTTAARGHSSDMASRGYFDHNTLEGVTVGTRVTNAGYRWSAVGENIAWGQATATAVMKDWMNSPGHKANILNCSFKNIGVGMAYNSSRRPYWTQDFGTLM